jgi:hypothetical protein
MPIIIATQKADGKAHGSRPDRAKCYQDPISINKPGMVACTCVRTVVQASPWKKKCKIVPEKYIKKKAEIIAQIIEHLPSKHKVWSWNTSTSKGKRERENRAKHNSLKNL